MSSAPLTRTLPVVLREKLAEKGTRLIIAEVVSAPSGTTVRVLIGGAQVTVPRLGSYASPAAGKPCLLVYVSSFLVALGEVGGTAGQTVAWGDITGKPANFPNDAKVDKVGSQNTARYAQGPDDATYTNTVSGGGFFAVWMDNTNRFGRNTSARRFKKNIRTHRIEPEKVLALRPVLYDRREKDGERDELGLVAEEVEELVPELAIYFDGKIDGVRYDLLSVALLSVVRDLAERVAVLEGKES